MRFIAKALLIAAVIGLGVFYALTVPSVLPTVAFETKAADLGKSLKGAFEKGEKSSPRMMVSAYATGLRLTLATVAAKNRRSRSRRPSPAPR